MDTIVESSTGSNVLDSEISSLAHLKTIKPINKQINKFLLIIGYAENRMIIYK